MPPSGEAYNVDWIWSNNSDVHVATHLDWFTSYHAFPTKIAAGFGPQSDVLGVGDVSLPVKTHATRTGRDAHGTLELKDVLYMPNGVCNILGDTTRDGVGIRVDFGSKQPGKLTKLDNGAVVGLLDRSKLCRLRLSGQSSSQTSLDKNGAYRIRANWSDSERQRWEAHRRQLSLTQNESHMKTHPKSTNPPYTTEEKQWLKENYKDEFHFLQQNGLSVYDEEERAEGRSLVRAFMSGDENKESENEDDGESDDGSTFLRELEEVPESHFADRHYSAAELKYIKKHYRYSSNFLQSYGLKFYDDGDCRQGKAILEQLMQKG